MRKRDLVAEKREKNEEYAKQFRRGDSDSKSDSKQKVKRVGGKWGSWCRVTGHPSHCSCTY